MDDHRLKETIIAQAQRIAYLESTINRLASQSPPDKGSSIVRMTRTPPPPLRISTADLLVDIHLPQSLPATPKKSDDAKAHAQDTKIPGIHAEFRDFPEFDDDFDLPEIPSSPLFGLPLPPMKPSYDSTMQDIDGEKAFALDDISLLDAQFMDFDPRTLEIEQVPRPPSSTMVEDASRQSHGYFPSIPCYYPSGKQVSPPLAVQCAEAICVSTPMHSMHASVQSAHRTGIMAKTAGHVECQPRFQQSELRIIHHQVLVSPPAVESGAWIPPQTAIVAIPEEDDDAHVPRVVFGPPAPPQYPPPKRGKPRRVPRPKGTVPPPPDHYTCHRCKSKGHWIEDCDMPRIIGAPPPHYVCHRCHFRGHWIEDCEKESALRTEMFMMPPASYVCKGCGDRGHWARHCPFV
jgi:hypothetical protein